MKIFKTFGYVYYNSVSSLAYYRDVLATKTSFSLKYFFALGVIFTAISTLNFSLRTYPDIKALIDKLPSEVARIYPNDLVISNNNNEWFINQPEPYAIAFPYKNSIKELKVIGIENLVVFDKKGTLESFPEYDTAILVADKFLYTRDNNKISAIPMKDLPKGSFAKKDLLKLIDETKPVLTIITRVIPFVAGFAYLLGNTSFMVMYALFAGLLLLLISAIFGKGLNYKQSFRIGLHAITLPWTAQTFISLFALSVPIPLWFTLITLMVGGSAIYSLPKIQNTHSVPLN